MAERSIKDDLGKYLRSCRRDEPFRSPVWMGQDMAERIRGKPTPPGAYETPDGALLIVVGHEESPASRGDEPGESQ